MKKDGGERNLETFACEGKEGKDGDGIAFADSVQRGSSGQAVTG